jgi:predicted flavoprotein YhiN
MDEKELGRIDIKINEALLEKKNEIMTLKKQGGLKIHPYQNKFEKLIKKYIQKAYSKDRYLKIYNQGHILEAVFAETEPYEEKTKGQPLTNEDADEIIDILKKKLSLEDEIAIGRNRFEEVGIDSIFIYTVKEKEEIDKIRKSIEEEK